MAIWIRQLCSSSFCGLATHFTSSSKTRILAPKTSAHPETFPTTSNEHVHSRWRVSPMLLPQLLAETATLAPEKAAVVSSTERISFRDLDRQSTRVSSRLHRLGIGFGDRVALLCDSSVSSLVYFWGVLKSNAQTVDVPLLSSTAAVGEVLAECKPRALITTQREWDRLMTDIPEKLPPIIFSRKPLTGSFTHHPCAIDSLDEILVG